MPEKTSTELKCRGRWSSWGISERSTLDLLLWPRKDTLGLLWVVGLPQDRPSLISSW
jgi:hypothetical protein